MLLVSVIAAVVFYFVFYGYLASRPRRIGERLDRGRARLVALLVTFAVFAAVWFLLFYLARQGLFGGIRI